MVQKRKGVMRPMDMNNIFILKDLVNLGGGQVREEKNAKDYLYYSGGVW